jgi:acetylornithine/N-succinyldiaminopimelate aminotransferase
VSFAKGIAGGLPFGGFLVNETASTCSARERTLHLWREPICSAGALRCWISSRRSFSVKSRQGAYIRSEIQKMNLPCVTSVRGLGLMVGIGVSIPHKEAAAAMIEQGLLALTAGSDTIRLLPPLTITKEEIDEGLSIFKQVLGGYEA